MRGFLCHALDHQKIGHSLKRALWAQCIFFQNGDCFEDNVRFCNEQNESSVYNLGSCEYSCQIDEASSHQILEKKSSNCFKYEMRCTEDYS